MSRLYRQQVVASAALTISGTTAEGALSPACIGVALGCHVVHTGAGFTLTITDERGYDVLQGLGTVGASGLTLNAADIAGNPCHGTLTANITGGTTTQTATVYLYIKSVPAPKVLV